MTDLMPYRCTAFEKLYAMQISKNFPPPLRYLFAERYSHKQNSNKLWEINKINFHGITCLVNILRDLLKTEFSRLQF